MSSYKAIPVTETEEYLLKRAFINKEINSQKVEIDKTIFRKNILEKKALKEAKKEYLLTVNTSKYEDDAVKTRNYIASHPMDCNNLVLIIKN